MHQGHSVTFLPTSHNVDMNCNCYRDEVRGFLSTYLPRERHRKLLPMQDHYTRQIPNIVAWHYILQSLERRIRTLNCIRHRGKRLRQPHSEKNKVNCVEIDNQSITPSTSLKHAINFTHSNRDQISPFLMTRNKLVTEQFHSNTKVSFQVFACMKEQNPCVLKEN